MYRLYLYFVAPLLVLSVFARALDPFSLFDYINWGASLFALLGLFGYVYKKNILSKKIWFYVLVINISTYLLSLLYSIFSSYDSASVLIMLFTIIFSIPLYYALYTYYRYFVDLDLIRKLGVNRWVELLLRIKCLLGAGLIYIAVLYIAIDLRVKKIEKLYHDKQYSEAYAMADQYIKLHQMSYDGKKEQQLIAKVYFIKGASLIQQDYFRSGVYAFLNVWHFNRNFRYAIQNKKVWAALLEARKLYYSRNLY